MNNKKIRSLSSLPKLAALLLLIFLSVGLFSACGLAGAAAKKGKTKKSKVKADSEAQKEAAEDKSAEEKSSKDSSEDEKEKDEKSEEAKESKEEKKESGDKKAEKKSAEGKSEKNNLVEAVWENLEKGNRRFMSGKNTVNSYSSLRRELSKGQKPEVIVLGCADSRVPPELVFDKNLGELFVVRDAGNVSDAVSLGSIEYAVEHLHAKMIVVLGHESCGAVAATVSGEKMPTKNLQAIVDRISPAFKNAKACPIGGESNLACVKLNVENSAKDILMNSPIIKEAIEKGKLGIVQAVYKMETGEVVRLN